MKQQIKMKDYIRIETYDSDGNVLDFRETFDPDNPTHVAMKDADIFAIDLITDAGLADIARMVAERYEYMSAGTGTTTPEHDDTGLESEALVRVVAATALSTTFYTNDTVTFTGLFTPSGSTDVTEAGIHLLASSSGDICFARETFPKMTCVSPFYIAWKIIFMR
jgi:hypothetical protein